MYQKTIKSILFLIVIACPTDSILGQKNAIKFRINQLGYLSAHEYVHTADVDLIVTPFEIDRLRLINLDISYFYVKDNLSVFFRCGTSSTSNNGKSRLERNPLYNVNEYAVNRTNLFLSTGIYKSYMNSLTQLEFNYGCHLGLGWQFKNYIELSRKAFDSSSQILAESYQYLEFAKELSAFTSLDIGVSYFILENIGIGLENNNLLAYKVISGNTNEVRSSINYHTSESDSVKIIHTEERKLLSTSFNISFVLTFKF